MDMDDLRAKWKQQKELAEQAKAIYEETIMNHILQEHQSDLLALARTIMEWEQRYEKLQRSYHQDKAPEYSWRL